MPDLTVLPEHNPVEEWVGYPLTICQECMVPWPCDAVLEATERADEEMRIALARGENPDDA